MTTTTLPKWNEVGLQVIQLANRAPSIHNTQPWHWRLQPTGAELTADLTRWLPATDPDRHDLTLSCGAALRLAAIAAASFGLRVETVYRPDGPAGPLASLQVVGAADPDEQTLRLAAAVPHRRSDRRPLDGSSVTDSLIDEFRKNIADGTSVALLRRSEDLLSLSLVTESAESVELATPAYRQELKEWTTVDGNRLDGIPAGALPPAHQQKHISYPQRNFGVATSSSTDTSVRDDPALLVIITESDEERGWLAAGETVMQVMLELVVSGLSSCPLSQPVDNPAFRARLKRELNTIGTPALILRVGIPLTGQPGSYIPRLSTLDVLE